MKLLALAILAFSLASVAHAQSVYYYQPNPEYQTYPVYQYYVPSVPSYQFTPFNSWNNQVYDIPYSSPWTNPEPTYTYQQPTWNQYPVQQDYELPQTYWQRQTDGSQVAVDDDGDPY